MCERVPLNGGEVPKENGYMTSVTHKIHFEDMASLLDTTLPEPEFIIDRLLYRGAAHLLAGPPGSGKSTLAYWCALEVLRNGGAVMVIDEESGTRQAVDKLRSLGATPADVSRLFYASFPRLNWTKIEDYRELLDQIDDKRPDLIMLDSSSPMLALSDLREDDNSSVQLFWSKVTDITRTDDYSPAILVIDHVVKSGETNGYARGAGAKNSNADVVFIVKEVKQFSRETRGGFTLDNTKDRDGCLPGAYAVEIIPGDVLALKISPVEQEPSAKTQRNYRQEITDHLSVKGELTKAQLVSDLHARKQTMVNALDAMVDDGIVSERSEGRKTYYSYVPAFREQSRNAA